ATHLKGWFEGETLYSLCARHHHIAGNAAASMTSRQLTGNPRAAAHDFPFHAHEIAARLGPAFGTAEEIAERRTILPFYLHLRSAAVRRDALATVGYGGCGGLKARLGLLAGRFGAAHPLKTCPHCNDAQSFAPAKGIWRIEHQWPGIWTCFRCGKALHWTTERTNGGNRFAWLLPADCQFRPGVSDAASDSDVAVLRSFSASILAYANRGLDRDIDPERFSDVYRERLAAMSLVSRSGRIDVLGFTSHVVMTTRALAKAHDLAALPITTAQVEAQLLKLVRNTFRPVHVLRHLALIQALFGDWEAWLKALGNPSTVNTSEEGDARVQDGRPDHPDPRRREQFLRLLSEGGSVTSASHATGIAIGTGISWAAQVGVAASRRPSLLTPGLRAAAIEVLRGGGSKETASKTSGVSISTINMLLKSDPGLRRNWHSCKFEQARLSNRQAWAGTAGRMSRPDQKQLRNLQPAVFAWLYRNDRDWLEAFNTNLALAPRQGRNRVDWDCRDHELAHAIQVARASIAIERPDRAVRIADLCNKVPGLKARLSQLDQLPLTRKAMRQRRRAAGRLSD
ncbi:TnsD family Tn7-like transposition protein, partial [Nevskia sp.]|uniref:TnsD family Tn7-like transposition protein n=1 Tax=Nevskia sp. TaxID=1929292 RepID=UPI003F6EAEC3